MMHQYLPSHLIVRIFECLETKQRARAALVCKDWRELMAQSWSSIQLSFTTLGQLEQQRKWLDRVAAQDPAIVRAVEIHWRGGRLLHPAAGSLHVEKFVNLEKLYLKPPRSAYWAVSGKALNSLKPLTRLKELILVYSPCQPSGDTLVTLEQFALFPLLQVLFVVLRPLRGWEPNWHLDLSPKLQGLKHLNSLSLSGLQTLVFSPTLAHICRKLQHLDLDVKVPIEEVLQTPNLISLRLKSRARLVGSYSLPFTGFQHLVDLCFGGLLPPSQLQSKQFTSLQKLQLNSRMEGDEGRSYMHVLGCLPNLRELRTVHVVSCRLICSIDSFLTESLEVFKNLISLEALILDLDGPVVDCGPRDVILCPSDSLSQLKHLTELVISSSWQGSLSIQLGSDIQHLPSLRCMDVETQEVICPIGSSSLTHLSLGRPLSGSMRECPTFTSLSQLQVLQLRDLSTLKECLQVADQLKNMPRLQELLLSKGRLAFPDSERFIEDPSGTFERLIGTLGNCANLKALQIIAVNDYVSLSRRILPAVQQVSLACRGVAICPSFFSGALPSLNLTFCKASPNTMKLLRSHMELSSAACPDLLREVWKATLLGKDAGVLDFDSGIFDAYCDSEAEY